MSAFGSIEANDWSNSDSTRLQTSNKSDRNQNINNNNPKNNDSQNFSTFMKLFKETRRHAVLTSNCAFFDTNYPQGFQFSRGTPVYMQPEYSSNRRKIKHFKFQFPGTHELFDLNPSNLDFS